MNNEILILPVEIQELSSKVEKSKQFEVGKILGEVFQQTHNWEQEANLLIVTDINDTETMAKAKELRLKVKNARLEAEKNFDQKRDEVQIKMVDFKTEDSLWLKSKQSMQIITKAIETKLEYQEKFAERFVAEQKESKAQTRLAEIRVYKPEIQKTEIQDLSDEMFDTLLAGVKKAHEDKIQADLLAQHQADERREKQNRLTNRQTIAFQYGQFFELDLTTDPSENIFQEALKTAIDKFEVDKANKAKMQADLDKANKEKADRDAEDKKKKEDKDKQDKADLQAKLNKEKADNEAREQEEKEKKNDQYKTWLKENKFNPVTDEVKPMGDGKFILYRKVSEIIIK